MSPSQHRHVKARKTSKVHVAPTAVDMQKQENYQIYMSANPFGIYIDKKCMQGLPIMAGNPRNQVLLIAAMILLLLYTSIITIQPAAAVFNAVPSTNPAPSPKVALTFDDGPSPLYTPKLLDGLAERKVKATFFVTGQNAEMYPEIIRRIQEEGHLIGNHTYSHLQLNAGNREKFKEELVKTGEILRNITGVEVLYVRPPYGSWDKSLEKELNLFPVLWNIDPLDWCTSNPANIVNRVLPYVEENAVILLHDGYDSTVTAALQIVDELLEKGYELVTVENILFD